MGTVYDLEPQRRRISDFIRQEMAAKAAGQLVVSQTSEFEDPMGYPADEESENNG